MTKNLSFRKSLLGYLGAADETVILAPSQKLRLSGKKTRIPLSGFPICEVEMGKQRLHLYPDLSVDKRAQRAPYDFILFDPQRYRTDISHFLRLSPGETLATDRNAEYQSYVFSSPRDAFRRHFSVLHEGDSLVFRDPISELGTYLTLSGLRPRRRAPVSQGAESDTPFIVGHHPYSEVGTLWLNAGHIDNHHIIISARPDRIGLMTRIDGDLIPEIYPTGPLRAWLNEQAPPA